jgi:Fe-S oxidoreductase
MPEPLIQIEPLSSPRGGCQGKDINYHDGMFCHPASAADVQQLGLPYSPAIDSPELDWELPPGWEQTILRGMKERLEKYRSFRLFMDSCVRCGVCMDKCPIYIGSSNPKNTPVLRGELMRAVYRYYFAPGGRHFPRTTRGKPLRKETLRQWFYYFYQCTECRRCAVYCPVGIDTAEITMIGRELLGLVGIHAGSVMKPAANSCRTGNNLGKNPDEIKQALDSAAEELEEITGVRVEVPVDRKGAEILFLTPSADLFCAPHRYTLLGYLALFHQIGLDYTFSTIAAEGSNPGLYSSHELAKRLGAPIYEEARRLGVQWILGGECGHMWRTIHQYLLTMNGPAGFLRTPESVLTGTRFEHASAAGALHICELTADLLHHGKLPLDASRNNRWTVTYHDSCHPARSMGMLEEPRTILRHAVQRFVEMPANTIRENTLCCGAGGGLDAEENFEYRMRCGYPRAMAVKTVKQEHGVNLLACICATDKVSLPVLLDYWVGGVAVAGVHELLGNALILRGEKLRATDLRGQPLL